MLKLIRRWHELSRRHLRREGSRGARQISWDTRRCVPFKSGKWKLGNVSDDYSHAGYLATTNRAKLKEMQAIFLTEAHKLLCILTGTIDSLAIELDD